jgi:hypothetical protein
MEFCLLRCTSQKGVRDGEGELKDVNETHDDHNE